MNEPNEFWANLAKVCDSELAKGVGMAIIILSITLGMGGCIYLERAGQAQWENARQINPIQPVK